jgi:hypothetical protein
MVHPHTFFLEERRKKRKKIPEMSFYFYFQTLHYHSICTFILPLEKEEKKSEKRKEKRKKSEKKRVRKK